MSRTKATRVARSRALVSAALVVGLVGAACSSGGGADPGPDATTPDGRDAGADGGPLAEDARTEDARGQDAAEDAGAVLDGAPDAPDAALGGPVSDTFNGASLSPVWTVIRPDLLTVAPLPASGQLRLAAPARSLWYNTSTGPLVYQGVAGDFSVTARVRVRRASDGSSPPSQRVHLAGLMARAPGGGAESYVFIVLGQDVDDLSVETKTTVAGVSTFAGPAWPSGDAELRICRVGATFVLLKRDIAGGAFVNAATYERADLPNDLQVGPFLYADTAAPDLAATFDEVTFARVGSAADCAR